jgi:hypothetical protein
MERTYSHFAKPAIPASSVCVTPDSPERSANDHGVFRRIDVSR